LKKNGSRVAIYDGTNTSLERRQFLKDTLKNESFQIIWVECVSNNQELIEKYIRESKVHNEDYKGSNMTE